jgi:hypothetical protein
MSYFETVRYMYWERGLGRGHLLATSGCLLGLLLPFAWGAPIFSTTKWVAVAVPVGVNLAIAILNLALIYFFHYRVQRRP